VTGTVYLLHFDRPFGPGGGANGRGTAKHSTGSPESSPILKVVSAAFGLVVGELAADGSLMDALRSEAPMAARTACACSLSALRIW
jgi:7-keto-8-aminopelargonate synthetase-like enzyme